MRKKEAHILIVDDDHDILFSAKVGLKRFFTNVITADSPRKIISILNEYEIDVVLLDMNYRKGFEDGNEGRYWQNYFKEVSPDTSVILMTAFGDVGLAVDCIKNGAFDFILKPWDNDKLYASVNAALDLARKKKKVNQLEKVQQLGSNPVYIGKSAVMKAACELAGKVAPTPATVLILGENGTGKFVFAQEIHRLSDRKNEPFIHVDLGSLNENLFESELFGYVKGAFTGADSDRAGRFELANGGTIFLDELGNLSLSLQAKLLTVIQNRKVTRLGEMKERPVDVRIIAATNAPIYQMVKEGKFRQDLLFRLNTMEIKIPALREQQADIPHLADFILDKFRLKYRKPNLSLTDEALIQIKNYAWPGNIRELENVLERAVILTENELISSENLSFSPVDFITNSSIGDLNLEEIEQKTIEKAMKKYKGNISHAAEALGLTRAALYRRLEKYGLWEN